MKDENDSIILDLSRKSTSGPTKYFCSYCNTRLTPLTDEDKIGGFLCIKCIITYWPNQQTVKKANRLKTPGPTTDEHGDITGVRTIPITTIDEPNKERFGSPLNNS
jgi:hypothetical protein